MAYQEALVDHICKVLKGKEVALSKAEAERLHSAVSGATLEE